MTSLAKARQLPLRLALVTALACAVALVGPVGAPPAQAEGDAPPCSTTGTWVEGELNIYWFDVEQGDSQLVIGPTGRTMLIDLGERSWNAYWNTMANRVVAAIQEICDISGPMHLDYVMASHAHMDHIGYAGNPNDTGNLGNGIYQLLHPDQHAFTVGELIDRDVGTWVDTNQNGTCEVGTSANPADEVDWHHAGTVSQTARRWVCWLHGPTNQHDRQHIEGRVRVLTNDQPWGDVDLGPGVDAPILLANAKGVMQADGITPVSGDHTTMSTPPSENDYSVAVKISFGDFDYATAGDSDGRYGTSSWGYTYNDVEAHLIELFGNVDTLRVNHHGSTNSSSDDFIAGLAPETAVIQCGNNSYGHPANRVLDLLRNVVNDSGVGADIYITNNPCATSDSEGAIDYTGVLNTEGDIWLHTIDGGDGYKVHYDAGTNTYTSYANPVAPGQAGPEDVVINEFLMSPQTEHSVDWIELYNPTGDDIDIGGKYIDDRPGARAPRQIPANTIIPAGGYYVMDIYVGYFRGTGYEEARYLDITGGVETVYDMFSYNLSSPAYDHTFRRSPDGGSWCSSPLYPATKNAANPSGC